MHAVRITRTNGTNDVAIPFRLEFLMTEDDLVTALAYSVKDEDTDDELPILSRNQAQSIIRDVLHAKGSADLWTWADYVDKEGTTVVAEWAESTVERCFGDILKAAREGRTK